MRKIDLIRGLENQRDHEHARALKAEAELAELRKGHDEYLMMFNAIMTGMAMRCGEKREEDGKLLGWRLALPRFSVRELNEKYDVRVEVTNDPVEYVIGVFPKEKDNG